MNKSGVNGVSGLSSSLAQEAASHSFRADSARRPMMTGMQTLGVSRKAASQGCPYHRMLLAQHRAAGESAGTVPLDQVVQTVRSHIDNPLKALAELHEHHGKAFQTRTDTGVYRFDHDPATARQILVGSEGDDPAFKKSEQQTHGLARALGRENLLLSSGDDWQSSRDALSDFFSTKGMRTEKRATEVTSILDRHLDSVNAKLGEQGVGEVELSGLFRRATLDVALNTLFSTQATEKSLDKLLTSFEVLNKRVGQEWLLPASVTGLEEPGAEQREATQTITDWAGDLVERRAGQADQPEDALTALMSAVDPDTGRPYSRERLVSEVKNLMLAGHETTANLITWTLTGLARNPIKQSGLFNQIRETVGDSAPNLGQMRKLGPVYDLWRQEATEHPPNFLLAREAVRDTSIGPKENPVEIKAGTTVLVSTQHANQEAKAMFSFGGGRRFCLGINLARLETELAITRFLQRFELSDTGARGMDSGLTQLPEDTLVSVRRR